MRFQSAQVGDKQSGEDDGGTRQAAATEGSGLGVMRASGMFSNSAR